MSFIVLSCDRCLVTLCARETDEFQLAVEQLVGSTSGSDGAGTLAPMHGTERET
jgi:hypothetical protein